MKAVVLCAGEGSKLRPLTDSVPAPLIAVRGRPLLDRILSSLAEAGVEEVLINLHHLPHLVSGFVGDGSRYGVSVRYFYEDELLGTAGALGQMRPFLTGQFFLVEGNLYLNDFPFGELPALLAARGGTGVVVTQRPRNPDDHPTLAVDEAGRVAAVRPPQGGDELRASGIYLLKPRILNYLGRRGDLGSELLPLALGRGEVLWAFRSPVPIVTIDRPENLSLVEERGDESSAKWSKITGKEAT